MKQTVFRFGIYSLLTLLVLSSIHVFFLSKVLDMGSQEILGYLSMLVSMIFVFFGIRYYRDHHNDGFLSFGQGLKIGVLIVLMPSIAFGLFDVLYTEMINPGWYDTYFQYQVSQATKGVSASEAAEKVNQLQAERERWDNPAVLFIFMALTVFILGFIVTIISSLALMRKRKVSLA